MKPVRTDMKADVPIFLSHSDFGFVFDEKVSMLIAQREKWRTTLFAPLSLNGGYPAMNMDIGIAARHNGHPADAVDRFKLRQLRNLRWVGDDRDVIRPIAQEYG